jgi:DNA mismatch repair ATPase MutS
LRSLLFAATGPPPDLEDSVEPAHFHDLNLDQAIDRIDRTHADYHLVPYFRRPLHDGDAVRFRQEIFRDLEDPHVYEVARDFAAGMRTVREHLERARKLHYARQSQRWFLEAVLTYCTTITTAANAVANVPLQSAGMEAARADIESLARSDRFRLLSQNAHLLREQLDAIRYNLLIRGEKVTAGPYDDEPDYSVQVLETFARFRQGDTRDYHAKFSNHPDMDHVEGQILDLVAKLHPQLFTDLASFCGEHAGFLETGVAQLDRELQFYLGYLRLLGPLRKAGLPICYPSVSTESKDTEARDTYDLALAAKLVEEGKPVVLNDFYLTGAERILVVSGPNQGGKTTLSRTFGQLHYLSALGCPVPGRSVRVHLPDEIFTHYEREEQLDTLRGKLADELHRVHGILQRATPRSVIILNEIFNSTTLDDARKLSEKIVTAITELDALAVCVSFIDEISRLNEKTVSMVSTVVRDDPARRTYRVVRQPADGRAYAIAIAEKYGLGYDQVRNRVDRPTAPNRPGNTPPSRESPT